MSNVNIDRNKLMELQDAEELLARLEVAGVNNWEGYSIALDGYTSKSELYERAEELLQELSENATVDFPAGREAGHQITYSDTAVDLLVELIKKAGQP